jgi:hypothetical protein
MISNGIIVSSVKIPMENFPLLPIRAGDWIIVDDMDNAKGVIEKEMIDGKILRMGE